MKPAAEKLGSINFRFHPSLGLSGWDWGPGKKKPNERTGEKVFPKLVTCFCYGLHIRKENDEYLIPAKICLPWRIQWLCKQLGPKRILEKKAFKLLNRWNPFEKVNKASKNVFWLPSCLQFSWRGLNYQKIRVRRDGGNKRAYKSPYLFSVPVTKNAVGNG